jgi:hypothetical protein
VLVALAVGWVIGVVVSLFVVPMVAEESSTATSGTDAVIVSRTTRPLLSASGTAVVALVAAAVLASVGLALWARRAGRIPRRTVLATGGLSAAFCFVAGFSIGPFFLPVPLLLLAAAAADMAQPSPAEAAGTQSPLNGVEP